MTVAPGDPGMPRPDHRYEYDGKEPKEKHGGSKNQIGANADHFVLYSTTSAAGGRMRKSDTDGYQRINERWCDNDAEEVVGMHPGGGQDATGDEQNAEHHAQGAGQDHIDGGSGCSGQEDQESGSEHGKATPAARNHGRRA